jgi:hypothetical protein
METTNQDPAAAFAAWWQNAMQLGFGTWAAMLEPWARASEAAGLTWPARHEGAPDPTDPVALMRYWMELAWEPWRPFMSLWRIEMP